MTLDMIDQVRIDRIEKRLSAVTVSMITVQAMVWGLVAKVGALDENGAAAAREALDAWEKFLSEEESVLLKPVMDSMGELLRKRGA